MLLHVCHTTIYKYFVLFSAHSPPIENSLILTKRLNRHISKNVVNGLSGHQHSNIQDDIERYDGSTEGIINYMNAIQSLKLTPSRKKKRDNAITKVRGHTKRPVVTHNDECNEDSPTITKIPNDVIDDSDYSGSGSLAAPNPSDIFPASYHGNFDNHSSTLTESSRSPLNLSARSISMEVKYIDYF